MLIGMASHVGASGKHIPTPVCGNNVIPSPLRPIAYRLFSRVLPRLRCFVSTDMAQNFVKVKRQFPRLLVAA